MNDSFDSFPWFRKSRPGSSRKIGKQEAATRMAFTVPCLGARVKHRPATQSPGASALDTGRIGEAVRDRQGGRQPRIAALGNPAARRWGTAHLKRGGQDEPKPSDRTSDLDWRRLMGARAIGAAICIWSRSGTVVQCELAWPGSGTSAIGHKDLLVPMTSTGGRDTDSCGARLCAIAHPTGLVVPNTGEAMQISTFACLVRE